MPGVEISVVIPCYNVGRYIAECLHSVVNQKQQPLEVICVDDGSDDDTIAVIETFVAKYPELITLIKNNKNLGAPKSRNRGLAMAKGNYIQFLDADDILFPNKFSHQGEVITASNPWPDIFVGSFSKKFLDGSQRVYLNLEIDKWVALIDNKIGVTSANLFKKSKLDEINGWKEDLGSSQEYDLMFRMMQKDAVVAFDGEMVNINREREIGSITKSNPKEKWKRYIDLRIRIYRHLITANQLTELREKVFLNNIFNAVRTLYIYDTGTAISYYRELLKGKYALDSSSAANPLYKLIYKLCGFRIAQEITMLVKGRARET